MAICQACRLRALSSRAARTAQEIEAAGWDGMLVVDSQNLSGDPYVALALAAVAVLAKQREVDLCVSAATPLLARHHLHLIHHHCTTEQQDGHCQQMARSVVSLRKLTRRCVEVRPINGDFPHSVSVVVLDVQPPRNRHLHLHSVRAVLQLNLRNTTSQTCD